MARVQYGGGVTAFKGSINGTTFQRNKSGEIARHRPANVYSFKTRQQNNINLFSVVRELWLTLTDIEKEGWNTYASLNPFVDYWGASKTLSGYNYFMSCNINLYNAGRSFTTLEPDVAVPSTPPLPNSLLATQTLLNVGWIPPTYGSGYVHTNYDLFFFASYITLNLSLTNRKDIRLLHVEPKGTTYVVTLATDWKSAFNRSSMPYSPNGQGYILICVSAMEWTYGLMSPFRKVLIPFSLD